jgi:hypothetical protein
MAAEGLDVFNAVSSAASASLFHTNSGMASTSFLDAVSSWRMAAEGLHIFNAVSSWWVTFAGSR